MADHGFWTYAQRDPRPLALVDPQEREWTRGELLAECNRVVHGLRALGLSHGDTVAICMPNCAEFYFVYLACLQSGWYLTPINFHLAAPEVAYIVQDCGAKAFIGHERVAAECARAARRSASRRRAASRSGTFRASARSRSSSRASRRRCPASAPRAR
jgi:long-chain acyl-CoA synthetase